MQLLDKALADWLVCLVDHHIDATEMVCCLNDIIHIDRAALIVSDTNRIRFKNISRLVVRQSASLDVVGIVGQIDLHLMINATFYPADLLSPQESEQILRRILFLVCPFRFDRIFRNIPCLSGQKSVRNPARSTIITNCSLRDGPFFCRISHR